ncbi:MAG: ribosomal biogenesis protein [Thermoplasmata archaeon]|nr:MAG: ribosomal biogenesis protein [Thermoplasmata archaeon]
MYMLTLWFGTFLMNDDGSIEKSILFPKNAKDIGTRLSAIADNKILDEERELIEGYNDIEHITLTEERLQGLFKGSTEINQSLTGPQPDQFDYEYDLLHAAALYRSKEQIVSEVSPEKHIIHAINSINELTQTANLLSERLHEWYGLHWPELSKQVNEREYLKLILEYGTREDIVDADSASESSVVSEEVQSEDVLGTKLSQEDIVAIQGLARVLNDINIERERLERYVKSSVEDLTPNTSKIAGPLITAKLIALTNGIKRLSRVSASTIQLLGAEKALFRHLRDGSSPPKHGVIFQHPLLHAAPYWQRGKIARALATKISIAIKIDYYKGDFQGDRLEEVLQGRINDIRARYPKAPKSSRKVIGKSKSKPSVSKPKQRKKGRK